MAALEQHGTALSASHPAMWLLAFSEGLWDSGPLGDGRASLHCCHTAWMPMPAALDGLPPPSLVAGTSYPASSLNIDRNVRLMRLNH